MFKHTPILVFVTASLWMAIFATPANAQWNCSGSTCSTSDNVDVNSTIEINSTWARLFLLTSGAGALVTLSQDGGGNGILDAATGAGQIILSTQGTGRVNVLQNGNVGIGTSSPQHLLHVAGTIGAEEVVVSSSGADYVFDPGYQLAPMSEVDEYIRQNHHLPGIPSASEMQQKGASVGDMQAKLLAKIEELTLHMIQAEKENQELRERIGRLEAAGGVQEPK
jgi:hypothetical protein